MKFDVVYERCAGLDVHKKTVEATIRCLEGNRRTGPETRKFGTMTADLRQLRDWLLSHGVTHVAMESTGVFWKPVFNLLEADMTVLLVNARHVKAVPGRKTDVLDSQWLAKLLQAGLLKASFVPSRQQRNLRDLTRQRTQLVSEKTRVINRIHKTLEDANIKLGSVATDIAGASGRAIIRALIDNETSPEKLADLAKRRLRNKLPELMLALDGFTTEHHRFLLEKLMANLEHLEGLIEDFQARIQAETQEFTKELDLLKEIPGISDHVARIVLAEVGPDMSHFPTHKHLASWAGICPGNNESAGKRKSGASTKGNRWLRTGLVQAAWAASRVKDSYYSVQFRRIAKRRGRKRALIAVAHSLLVAIYHMLKGGKAHDDLGADFFDKLAPERLTTYLVRRLQQLGHQVTLSELQPA